MNSFEVTVGGTLRPDGVTLLPEKKLALPPGPVSVTLQAAREPSSGAAMIDVLRQIHLEQSQRGQRAMTEQEMADEIAKSRAEDEEYDERWRSVYANSGTRPMG